MHHFTVSGPKVPKEDHEIVSYSLFAMITSPTKRGVIFILQSENRMEKNNTILMEMSEDSKGNLEWTITKEMLTMESWSCHFVIAFLNFWMNKSPFSCEIKSVFPYKYKKLSMNYSTVPNKHPGHLSLMRFFFHSKTVTGPRLLKNFKNLKNYHIKMQ